jgi:hypothetical protein
MPIEGPVRELALSDLLQLLFLSRRTGRLVVSDETGNSTTTLDLDGGALTGASGTTPGGRIGELLVGSGRATGEQVRAAITTQRQRPGKRLGEILVEAGAVRDSEVRRHLRLQIEEAVFDLLRWSEGTVRFEETPSPLPPAIEIRLPTDGVLMEAVRRLDEWAEVTASLPDPDPLPVLAVGSGPGAHSLSFEPLEWEVLAKVDGETTLKEIARGLGRPELDVARSVYRLAEAGIVELSPRPTNATESSVWDSEIHVIEETLRAGWIEEADRRTVALLAQRPAAAGLHVLRGRILAAQGDDEEAQRAFQHAVELDPLLAPAYFHLARITVRLGDFSRGHRALNTYRRLSDTSEERRNAATRLAACLDQLMAALDEVVE